MSGDKEAVGTQHCLDLFSGLGGFSQAFADSDDWTVTTVDINDEFSPDVQADVVGLSWADVGTHYDVVLAGPPCPGFSLMNVSDNWDGEDNPDSESARDSLETMYATFRLIESISPEWYVIENPVGMAAPTWNGSASRSISSRSASTAVTFRSGPTWATTSPASTSGAVREARNVTKQLLEVAILEHSRRTRLLPRERNSLGGFLGRFSGRSRTGANSKHSTRW